MARLDRNRVMFFGSWDGKPIPASGSINIGDSTGVTAAVFAERADFLYLGGKTAVRERIHGHVGLHAGFVPEDIELIHTDADRHAVVRRNGEDGLLLARLLTSESLIDRAADRV